MSEEQFNINSITAEVIHNQLTEITKTLTGELKQAWQKHFASFKRYLQYGQRKHWSTKTLLYKDRAVPLTEIYVGTRFFSNATNDGINEYDVLDQLLRGKNILISATAGSGKSFFSKYLFLALLSSKNKVPLLIELRNLNDSGRDIIQQISFDLKSSGVSATESVIYGWLKSGKFVLILDGYDELNKDKLQSINSQIKDLSDELGESSLVVTTRPNEQLEYFSNFDVYNVLPLSKSQAISLVKKLNYDKKIKERFLSELEEVAFEKHKDFLSNPLLLTIMLMTYGEIAEIPSKMHVFYEQAFDALFFRHDSSKGMYTREKHTGLAIDDFKDMLSAVSASGYIRSKISFSNSELISYIRKAKKTTGNRSLSPELFKQDLLESVCILIADGSYYTYNHRSFQEYFSALFLVQLAVDDKFPIYRKFLARGAWDNSLVLAFEMQQNRVEADFIRPYIRTYSEIIDEGDPLKLLSLWFNSFVVRWIGSKSKGQPHYGIEKTTEFFNFYLLLERLYRNIAGRNWPNQGRLLSKKAFIEEFGFSDERHIIPLEEISAENIALLERLGVIEFTRRRLNFLKWLKGYLNKKQDRMEVENIEEWM